MKANELMIGDWVQYISDNVSTPNTRVLRINIYDKFSGKDLFFNEKDFGDYLDDIRPIPLTPEILEKNGFEIDYFGRRDVLYNEHTFMRYIIDNISQERYFTMNIANFSIRINYVHELQHALRLCGLSDLADKFEI